VRHGVIVIDKPTGATSAGTVEHVRRQLRVDRAGHAGTLDPIATGVLPICVGAATKLAQFLLVDDKAYEADGRLGVTTDTLDRTGRVLAERAVDVGREAMLAELAARLGAQDQIPPMFSAIKQGGVRLYDRARAGEDVERAPRRIRIDRLDLLAFDPPHFRIAIACSKGTYVRSVIADVGAALGPGAHLTELRRTQSGRFTLAHAVPLDRLADATVIDPAAATGLPAFTVDDELVPQIFNGVQLPIATFGAAAVGLPQFQLVDARGGLLAIAHPAPFPDHWPWHGTPEDHATGRTVYDRVFPELSDAIRG
jgi:tRNA pseudouridine(55) synthase